MSLNLPTYPVSNACLVEASLETKLGYGIAMSGETITFRFKMLNDTQYCNRMMRVVTCSYGVEAYQTGESVPLTPRTNAQVSNNYYSDIPITIGVTKFQRTARPDGDYEIKIKLRDDVPTTFFDPDDPSRPYRGCWVGIHYYDPSKRPQNEEGLHGWAYMIPFNFLAKTALEDGELEKIRADLGLTSPNPFGDSYCLICDAISGVWKLVNKALAPNSPGYGWHIPGHEISVYEDASNNDMVLKDGNGSFDRWVKNANGSYSPRYKNNYAMLEKNATTNLVKITHKDKVVMNFLSDGKLGTIVDRNGNTTTYHYDGPNGILSSIDDGEGRSSTYDYGTRTDGQPVKILTQDSTRFVSLTYDVNNRMSSMINASGEGTRMEYHSDPTKLWDGAIKRKIEVRDATTEVTQVEYDYYDSDGKLKAETFYGNQERNTYAYSLDPVTGWTVVTVQNQDLTNLSEAPRASVYYYDDRFRMIRTVDPIGNNFRSFYNDANNPYLLTDVVDPNNATTSYKYNADGNVTKVVDAKGYSTTMSYTEGYLLSTIQRPKVTVGEDLVEYSPTLLGYDSKGNLTSITDKLNGSDVVTRFNPRTLPRSDGRVGSIENRLGKFTEFTYTDHLSDPTVNTGNLLSIKLPVDARDNSTLRVVSFDYDKSDNRISSQDPDSSHAPLGYEFDLRNRLIKSTDSLGAYIDYSYTNGFLNSVTMPSVQDSLTSPSGSSRVTRFERDTPGRVLKVFSQKSAVQEAMRVRQEYDGRSNVTKLTRLRDLLSPEKPAYEFLYDSLNRPKQQKNPLGDLSSIEYDPYCKTYTTTSARGIATTVSRDSLCRVSEISTSEETRAFEYDELGRLIMVTQTIQPSGDRYVDVANPGSSPARWGQARWATSTPIVETTTFLYDELDRLVKVTYPGNKIVSYEYDLEGRVIKQTDVLNNVTRYEYLNDGKLYKVIAEATSSDQVFTYSYDLAGRIEQITYPGSVVVAKLANDNNGRLTDLSYHLTSATGPLLRSFHYEYDASGNRKKMVDVSTTGTTTWKYSYDWFNRLASVQQDSNQITYYAYDESDNRVSLTVGASVQSYTYDDGDRLKTRTIVGQVDNFAYDKDGNLVERMGSQNTQYSWDSFNKLTAISGTVSQVFSYDSEGIRKTIGSDTKSYSSGSLSLADLKTETPANSISWVQGHALLGLRKSDQFFWYLTDGLGSVRLVVNSSGNVVAQTNYDEFGNQAGSSSDSDYRLHTYAGSLGVRSESSGLYYARQRWYDPTLGRWLNEDPIGFGGDLNLYAYANNNPVFSTDYRGLFLDPDNKLGWGPGAAAAGLGALETAVGALSAQPEIAADGLVRLGFGLTSLLTVAAASTSLASASAAQPYAGFESGTEIASQNYVKEKVCPSLYHYTSEEGRMGIVGSGSMLPSLTPKYARHGKGQYFTDIAPEAIPSQFTMGQLMARLFGMPVGRDSRMTDFLQINVSQLEIVQVKAHIFLHPSEGPLDVSDRIFRHGKTMFSR